MPLVRPLMQAYLRVLYELKNSEDPNAAQGCKNFFAFMGGHRSEARAKIINALNTQLFQQRHSLCEGYKAFLVNFGKDEYFVEHMKNEAYMQEFDKAIDAVSRYVENNAQDEERTLGRNDGRGAVHI